MTRLIEPALYSQLGESAPKFTEFWFPTPNVWQFINIQLHDKSCKDNNSVGNSKVRIHCHLMLM